MCKWLMCMILLIGGTSTRAESIDLQPPQGISYRAELLVQLGVQNLDRAVRFYLDMLGFVVLERRDDLKFVHIATNVLRFAGPPQ
jgi:Glyoxalase/Bleomycin resistance protein/Dioxygenase superfamily